MSDLAAQIELFLLDRGTWVPASEVCARFSVTKRQLRADGARPAMLDDFAVSSTRGGESGYIHISFLATEEYLRARHRVVRHATSQLRKARRWARARSNSTKGLRPHKVERGTGQGVFW